ncbi:hypothetical protein [Caenispirillum bisanense]|uniref:Uncharacterized protein n=1 Tax=Caenispirillum bisanense TaxID=414052 RepID=A0A286GB86_9PROT|nr:hypothetical protein [Caenispirillum bisanense]SOD92752.1 hypothetical protein SAMN05421508_102592 [Caenispirillum bisanense]
MAHPIAEAVLARYRPPPRPSRRRGSVDAVVEAFVNVPFPAVVRAGVLAAALRAEVPPADIWPQVERLLAEAPMDLILRFCDTHGVTAQDLARAVGALERHGPRLHRNDLQEHLHELLSRS